jgi:hypothetical protein
MGLACLRLGGAGFAFRRVDLRVMRRTFETSLEAWLAEAVNYPKPLNSQALLHALRGGAKSLKVVFGRLAQRL